jgi:predicted transcriptional regulator
MRKSLVELAADVVSSFVSHNSVPRSELSDLVQSVHHALSQIETRSQVVAPQPESKVPAVSIRKSIMPDYLICLDDGRKFKSLRRHLALLGMTPQQYREKWNLPDNYPMVAPNYAATRSALAKRFGLGQSRKRPDGSRLR